MGGRGGGGGLTHRPGPALSVVSVSAAAVASTQLACHFCVLQAVPEGSQERGSGGENPPGKEDRIVILRQAPPAQRLGLCSFLSCPLASQVPCFLESDSLLPVPLVSGECMDPFTSVQGSAALPHSFS